MSDSQVPSMIRRLPLVFSSMITLYDIPSTLPGKAWSPNTWKARYALNYKGVPYKTIWLEYPEIEPLCKKIGAKPTEMKPDGVSPFYTLPVIQDDSTGAVVSDSSAIAAYLDVTYPDAPTLIPAGTAALQSAFHDTVLPLVEPLFLYALPATLKHLNPVSAEYFRRTREATFGCAMEEIAPKGADHAVTWKKLHDALGKVDEWIRAGGEDAKYVMGDTLSYADLFLAAYMHWSRHLWEDSHEWDKIKEWHGGRWSNLMKSLEKYEATL